MSKIIKLLNLKLTNFKGIKSFELKPNGQNIIVFGDNATGKTTLFDAFVWLLFDKDSHNQKDFSIKTMVDGKVQHNLNHEVEAEFLVDNQILTLKKVFTEKWTKKRGSVAKEFTGHTTDYFINGVPRKKKEYTDKVDEIVDEDVFKLLTSPSYFNEQLHWKERRATLLSIAGDISDEDVISSNKNLTKLSEILGKRSIDDHKKVIAAQRKTINDELERIPIRIDEINRNMPNVEGLSQSAIKTLIDKLNAEIDEKNAKISDLRNGGGVNELKMQISDIDLMISKVRNEHEQQGQTEVYKLQAKVQEEESNVRLLNAEIENQKYLIELKKDKISELEKQANKKRKEWSDVNESTFEHEQECICPTCGQDLPQEQLDEARDKALNNFNRTKAETLEKIIKEGKSIKAQQLELIEQVEILERDLIKAQDQLEVKKADLEKIQTKLKEVQQEVKPIESNTTYMHLVGQKQELNEKIASILTDNQVAIKGVETEIIELKTKLLTAQENLAKLNTLEKSKERISELEAQEKSLAVEFERLEEELYLAEEFIRTKVNMLTDKINSKFKYARFKLFEEQINGGLTEVCETTYKGVPYSSGLNNAARINVGLDIINTLSKNYGVQAPIFIDNAESVTSLIDIESQIISLIVSEKDKELRVETKSISESEVA